MRVVIVGAGVTGLVAAFELARAGTEIECLVLEAAPRAGGNVVTLCIDGCLLDAGPDGVATHRREGTDLCRELELLGRLEPPGEHAARVLVARDGLVHGVPRGLGAALFSPLLTPRGRARALLDLVLPRGARERQSVGALARRRLGREVTDYLVEPLVGGILAADIDTLDACVATPLWAGARRSLIGASVRPPLPTGPAFLSPREGMCEIVDALVARIGEGRIVKSAPVEAVRRTESSWHVQMNGGGERVADAVVIATPARAAARMLEASDVALSSRLGELRTESIASVLLCFDDPRSFPSAGSLFLPRVERRATFAASFLTRRWPWRSTGKSAIVRAYVGGARAPELLARSSDSHLVALVLSDLARYFDLPEPRWSHVVRFEASVPIPGVGHAERIRQIHARAALCPGLFFAGGAYGTGVGFSSCVAEGRRAARAVLEALRRQA